MDARAQRIAGWSGITFSVLSLIVIPFVAGSLPPPLGATGASLAAWHAAHRTGFLIGNFLGIAAFVPGLVQLAILAASVRKLEGEGGFLSTLVLATGVFAYAVFACSLCVFQALPFLVEPRLEAAMEGLGSLGAVWFALDGLVAIPLVIAVGWAVARTGVLPRSFARASWILVLVALFMSFGALTSTPAWLAGGGLVTGLGFLGFFAWTFAIALAQLRAKPQ
jgi:hypothetical protein